MEITERVSLTGDDFKLRNALIVNAVAFDIGTRVFKWWEPAGYSQYETNRVVLEEEDQMTGMVSTKIISGRRYGKRKNGVDGIRQVLFHHSGADRENPGTMRNVLHNQRGLSVQFAIEDDGRIYQFLDAVEVAWHAGKHNEFSVGAECCLYPDARQRPNYYNEANRERTGNLVHEKREEVIQGIWREVFCFPQKQVEACARWAAGIWFARSYLTAGVKNAQAFQHDQPLFPRTPSGEIPREVFDQHMKHVGLIGHLQCTPRKWDPAGFPWEEVEELVGKYYWSFANNWSAKKEG